MWCVVAGPILSLCMHNEKWHYCNKLTANWNLLTAKSKLVPNKELPFPRLELMKAVQEKFGGWF